jgi:hypothetical protein
VFVRIPKLRGNPLHQLSFEQETATARVNPVATHVRTILLKHAKPRSRPDRTLRLCQAGAGRHRIAAQRSTTPGTQQGREGSPISQAPWCSRAGPELRQTPAPTTPLHSSRHTPAHGRWTEPGVHAPTPIHHLWHRAAAPPTRDRPALTRVMS